VGKGESGKKGRTHGRKSDDTKRQTKIRAHRDKKVDVFIKKKYERLGRGRPVLLKELILDYVLKEREIPVQACRWERM